MTSSEESDVEMSSKLVPMKKITKKPPRSPTEDVLTKHEEPKKVSTKIMIHKALTELRSRKGVSLYAIKKNIEENYKVDTEKINYYIKKYIKNGVETGTIIQTKGIGASGSFRLAAVKEKVEKKKNIAKATKSKAPKEKLEKSPLPKKLKIGVEKKKIPEKKEVLKKKTKPQSKVENPKMAKAKTEKLEAQATTKKLTKAGKHKKTPTKNRAKIMKRKSVGSIIKPPKMKPKVKA